MIGSCGDQRFVDILNEAQERLLPLGHWYDTMAKVRFCAIDGCVTMPPQIATIEKVNVCGRQTPVHDMIWEFLENGYGSMGLCSSPNTSTGCCSQGGCGVPGALFRGYYAMSNDIIPPLKKVNLVCDVAADVGKTALVLGYDDNGNWVRTVQGGVYQDGEVISFSQTAGTLSVTLFSSVADIQLPAGMQGQSWIYEYDTTTTNRRLLSHYEYFETRPHYPRYFFPGINPQSSGGSCTQTLVEALVKLAYVPVVNDTDYLIISNFPALKEMMMAIHAAEHEPDSTKKSAIIATGTKVAVAILDSELDHYLGVGRRMGMNFMNSSIGSVDPVPNFV